MNSPANNLRTPRLPDIILDTGNHFTGEAIAQLVKQGQIKKLGPKIYTSLLDEPAEQVVQRNIFSIAGRLWPGAVVSWRTAFEQAPSPNGSVYLTYHTPRKVRLPGHTLKLIQGHSPLDGDKPYMYDLHRSSPARAFLENIAARRREKWGWALDGDALLAQLAAIKSPAKRQLLFARARELAVQFDWQPELAQLAQLLDKTAPNDADITAAEKTHTPPPPPPSDDTQYDDKRLRVIETLFHCLREHTYRNRPQGQRAPGWDINRAFFEAYCSNYLAGLEFDIEDAHQVIMDKKPIAERPMDSTVLLNNYLMISHSKALSYRPTSGADLLALLQARHRELFINRDDVDAGCFRHGNEATDNTRFIAAEHVRGTLLRGFEFYQQLQEPFTRAVFMLFLVRECHPFDNGSGRIARTLMNAELTAENETRIIIPPVYCGDYWLGLRALARGFNAGPFVRALTRAHAFSAAIHFDTYQAARQQWQQCNAFMAPDPRTRMHEV